ncbi:hypothetical protein MKX03_017893, partial [Papaver bracteatum]
NLAHNNLSGTVPLSLENNKNLKLTLTGNKLCFSDEDVCPLSLKEKLKTIAFVIVMAACIIILL